MTIVSMSCGWVGGSHVSSPWIEVRGEVRAGADSRVYDGCGTSGAVAQVRFEHVDADCSTARVLNNAFPPPVG